VIENLEGLTSLRQLELGANRVREISGLETLVALEELWLGKNKITEIRGLDTLSNLKILSIQSNRLRSISGLSSLSSLTELHISHNLLTSLSGLEHNTSLRVIDISANPIAQLTGLETLTHLTEFWASNCKLSSYDEVEKQLRDKEELETVYFEGNPLQKQSPVLYRNKVRLALPQVRQIDASKSHLNLHIRMPELGEGRCLGGIKGEWGNWRESRGGRVQDRALDALEAKLYAQSLQANARSQHL
jgi:protein phosphatase 1 regulatory subunit 7